MSKWIALYGGSFNPPTRMHLQIGKVLRDRVGFDEVWYVVSPQNRLKSTQEMASFKHRLKMVRLNVFGEDRLRVTGIEKLFLKRTGEPDVQTYKSFKWIQQKFSHDRFAFAMGADSFLDLPKWGHYEDILKEIPLIVVPREGSSVPIKDMLRNPLGHESVVASYSEDVETLRQKAGWTLIDVHENNVNATACRAGLAMGVRVPDLLKTVKDYAVHNKIYMPTLTLGG